MIKDAACLPVGQAGTPMLNGPANRRAGSAKSPPPIERGPVEVSQILIFRYQAAVAPGP